MFTKQNRQSINQINIIAILFAGIFAGISAFIIIFNELIEFEKEVKTAEKVFLQNQKRKIVDDVSRLNRLIKYRFTQSNGENLEKIKSIIAKEIEVLIDDKRGSYLFVYDKNNKAIYESTTYSKENIEKFIKTAKKQRGIYLF